MLPRDISKPDAPDLAALRALLDEVREFELGAYESLSLAELQATLVPRVRGLLRRALSAVEAIAAFGHGRGVAWEGPLDLAFLAELELSQGLSLLDEATHGGGVVELLGQCDSAVTRTGESLTALGQALGLSQPAVSGELQRGLALRRAYANFRRDVLVAEGAEGDFLRRMRRAGTRIAMLVGEPVFPRARVRDRFLVRALQGRILAWLRTEEPRCEAAARTVLSDLATFARMLALVNLRQELRAHDALVLARLHALPAVARSDLDVLRGLDDELDDLMTQVDGCESPRLRERLRELGVERHVIREYEPRRSAQVARA